MQQTNLLNKNSILAYFLIFLIVSVLTVFFIKACADEEDYQEEKAKTYQAQFKKGEH